MENGFELILRRQAKFKEKMSKEKIFWRKEGIRKGISTLDKTRYA